MSEIFSDVFYFPTFNFNNNLKSIYMQELIDKLKTEAGLTDEQAKKPLKPSRIM